MKQKGTQQKVMTTDLIFTKKYALKTRKICGEELGVRIENASRMRTETASNRLRNDPKCESLKLTEKETLRELREDKVEMVMTVLGTELFGLRFESIV